MRDHFSATEVERIGRIGDLLHVDFGVMEVWREEHGRIFVLSIDDAHDARVLMDYFPLGTEEQEVVYNSLGSSLFRLLTEGPSNWIKS